jgi:NTE family protein
MGALIGGFHAAGKLDDYRSWVGQLTEVDVLRFLDISLTARSGFMKGDRIMDKLRGLVGDCLIEELPIPFTAVATDIVRRQQVWINRGDLFDAIRASISVPGLFTPHIVNGRTLVDGGLLNPLPVAPSMFHQNDLTIAVSLSGREINAPFGPDPTPEPPSTYGTFRVRIERFLSSLQESLGIEKEKQGEKQLTLSGVLLAMFDTMQAAIARYRLAAYPPDILIEIPSNICDTHEYYKAGQLIDAGRYWAGKFLPQQSGDD